MLFERLRAALLFAALTVALLPTAIGRGQEASVPPVADPAASAEGFSAAPFGGPTLAPSPPVAPANGFVAGKAERSAPRFDFKVQLHSNYDRGSIFDTLEAEGFDIQERGTSGDWSTWNVAPPSGADLKQSEVRLREALGSRARVELVGLHRDISPRLARSLLSLPVKSWFFKWQSPEPNREKQIEELGRVSAALAESPLVTGSIASTPRHDGQNYVYLESTPAEIPKIEEFVRTLVKEPKFWRPPLLDNYFTQHAKDGAAEVDPAASPSAEPPASDDPAADVEAPSASRGAPDKPATADGAASLADPEMYRGLRWPSPWPFRIELPPGFELGPIEATLGAEGFDVRRGQRRDDGWSEWRIAPPSESDLERSEERLRDAFGADAKVRGPLDHDISPQSVQALLSLPVRPWFIKFVPKKGSNNGSKEFNRITEALKEANLGIIRTATTRDPDGDCYVYVDSPVAQIPKIEELVRMLVEDPKFWRPPALEPYLAKHTADEAAESPGAGVEPTPIVDPATVAEEPSTAQPSELAPKLSAKVLLIETDWTKANDRNGAWILAHSLSNRVFDDDRAGKEVFPPGYAATFAGDEARRVGDDLQRLGLVRQAMSLSQVDLKIQAEGVEALGAATVSFQERAANGQGETVTWNLLVVTEPAPLPPPGGDPFSQPRPATAPPASPPAGYRVAVVSWKDRTAAKSQSQEEVVEADVVPPAVDAAPEQSERYVGSFVISRDQSAIVPLALPGLEGALIVIAPAQKGPAVRSLGPRGGILQRWGLTAEFSVDWDELIRAYEASPLGVAGAKARTIEATEKAAGSSGGEETADVTFTWRPAQEGQVEQLEKALRERYPQTDFVGVQFQGEQGASLVVRTPVRFAEAVAEAIEGVAAQIFPGVQSMNSSIAMVPPENQEAEQGDERPTLVFHLKYAASDEVAKLLEALKLDPAIRLVSDARTNSIVLSAPEATKYRHVQAAIDLLKELDRPVEATPAAEKGTSDSQPDRAANAAKLRSDLARVEADVQKAAEAARAASGPERTTKSEDLRQVVAAAFDLRLKLQREEAAELRDRLKKVEENLARRERIQNAVIDRRVEVLLDPALEWPEVKSEGSSSPPAVAASLPAGDTSEKSGDGGSDLTRKAVEVQGRGDAFAAATSLAREIDDLTEQAQAIERDGTPDGSEVRLALIRRQTELLRQEFDARQQALKLELDSLKAKLSGAQASFERVRTLVDTGALSQGEVAKVEADLKAAQSDVARQEVLLQQYDRAKASLSDIGIALEGISSDSASVDPAALQGTWRVVRQSLGNDPLAVLSETTWTIDGDRLTESQTHKDGQAAAFEFAIEHAVDDPGAFTRVASSGAWAGARRLGRFEVQGSTLRVALRDSPESRTFPDKAAPSRGNYYMEFARVETEGESPAAEPEGASRNPLAEGADVWLDVPNELRGAWRLKKFVAKSAPDAKTTITTWTFDEESLHIDVMSRPGGDRHAVTFPADRPGTFQAYALLRTTNGRELEERIFNVRYEVEGDLLRAAFSGPDAAPEKVAPAEGVIYYEFERAALSPYSPLVPTESPEAVAEPELVQRARKIAESLKAKEQALQEQKARYASISKADATADGVKATIETYQREALDLRNRLREMEFFVERMAEAARSRAEAAESEEDKLRLAEEAERLDQIARSVGQVAISAGVERKPDWRPAVRADAWEPWGAHGELHEDYRRAREKQKGLTPESDDYQLAQDRIEWIIRTARDARSSISINEGMRENALTEAKDTYFSAEKRLAETRSRVATRDELEAAEFELARAAYAVERTREILDAATKREAELDTLFREIDSDAEKATPLKVDEASAPGSNSAPSLEDASPPAATPDESASSTEAAEEALSP